MVPALLIEDVNFAEVGDGGVDSALPVGLFADVHFYEDCLTAGFIDFLGDALSVFHLDVGQEDFSAFFGEDTGFGGAHAAGCAGDDGYFILGVAFIPPGELGLAWLFTPILTFAPSTGEGILVQPKVIGRPQVKPLRGMADVTEGSLPVM